MEFLPDPIGDRTVKTLDPPPNKPLRESVIYPNKGKICPISSLMYSGAEKDVPDWKFLKDFLVKEGSLTKPQLLKLLKDGIAMFSK